MPVYGDLALVRKMLRPVDVASLGTDVESRLEAIREAVSLDLEYKLGRTFGVTAVDESVVHWIGPYDTLVLNRPARSITSIQYGGTFSGSSMTGGTTVLGSDLYNAITDPYTGLIYAIGNSASAVWDWSWTGPVTNGKVPVIVTGDFANTDDDATVPADITYAANILIVKTFQIETAGPAGFTGPDGVTVPISDPWKHPSVKAVVAKYSIKSKVPV